MAFAFWALRGSCLSASGVCSPVRDVCRPRTTEFVRPDPRAPLVAEPQGLAAEIVFQRKVARAINDSPTVTAVLTRTLHSRPTTQEPT
ncbi:hypothetical protein TPA0910_30480 [Streptomyces hygroscopicus subsp. sporocinereus]|uniref:Secreted protein n=1 Tax=Streptomyces hygroscopicus TaxID=1912 RepID=A0ABQ3TZ40_STRHY|nr:hypothetical protein TPA0910_30480 [Streptomyces hygroscopicus]